MLNIGESGCGKTGALASLVVAGYNLWILDYDNGLDILVNALKAHYGADQAALTAALGRVQYETLRDETAFINGVPKVKSPVTAWKGAGQTMKKWLEAGLGTPADIVVVDTLSTMSNAAFNEALMVAGRLNQRPQQNDYGWMADSVMLFMGALTDDDAKYNVIVNTHIRYLAGNEDDQTSNRGLPNAKGQQIPKDIGKFFNSAVLTRSQGTGPATKRLISTQPQGVIEVKTSNPFSVKATYPVDTGMAQLFHDLLGHGPPVREATPPNKPTVSN